MTETLKQIRDQAIAKLYLVTNIDQLDKFVLEYFGRKQGKLTNVLRSLKNLSATEKKNIGKEANDFKIEIWRLIDQKRRSLKTAGKKELIDLTIDGTDSRLGHLHPITQIRREIEQIFRNMGYAVMLGPEIETDYYNFEALNIPPEHPARDMWDTFYLNNPTTTDEKLLLRTHISPMQVRVMEKHTPPFAVVSAGRVFRREATDARHEHTWDYLEGMLVGKNISLANLKDTLTNLFRLLFGAKAEIKFRASYFPFTEPSLEVIMGCIFCDKKGCPVCHTGWLEMLGAGMINPKVFAYAGYPKDTYTGFAFGIGLSRVAMIKYNISDIRLLYQNDQRFLHQF